jgi:O-antigen ligase
VSPHLPDVRGVGTQARVEARRRATAWPALLGVTGAVVLAAVLMAVFIVLDYHLDQAEHRIFKVAAGIAALGAIVSQPQLGLLLMPVATPFLPWVPPTPIPGLNPLNVLLFSIFGTFALGRIARRQPVLRASRLGLPIGLLLLMCAVSIVRGAAFPTGLGYDPADAGLQLFRSATTFASYFIVLAMVRGLPQRRRVLWAVLAGLLAEAVITIAYGRNGSGGRAIGTFGQANELGSFLALFTVVAVAMVAGVRALWGRALLLTIAVLGAIGLLMSLSRGGMLALAVSLAIVAWRTSRTAFAVLVAGLLLSPLWAPDYVKQRVMESQVEVEGSDQVAIDSAAEARVQTWRSIFEVVEAHPIEGVGWTGLGHVLPDIGTQLGLEEVKDSAHNTFLRLLGETGLIGLGLFCWLLWSCWALGDRLVRAARNRFDRALGIAMCGAVVSMAVSCAFGDRFFNVLIAGNFWMLCALVEDGAAESEGWRS